MNSDTGKWIIIAGLSIVVIGILIYFFHDKLNWKEDYRGRYLLCQICLNTPVIMWLTLHCLTIPV